MPFHIYWGIGKVTVAHYDGDVNMYQFSWQPAAVATFQLKPLMTDNC